MSSALQKCVYCDKVCKASDSRPYLNSKSQERIHNKCHIKRALSGKQATPAVGDKASNTILKPSFSAATSSSAHLILDKFEREQQDIEQALDAKRRSKILDKQLGETKQDKSGQFFFDLRAGIAKPHERRRFLHHRNLSELSARFDDNGFKEESIGRAYDHSGKELDTLGDDNDDDDNTDTNCKVERGDSGGEVVDASSKRKLESRNEVFNTAPTKKKKNHREILDEKNQCWFCLSSPNVEKHLIISIGEYCYLALAKGGLHDEHFLILPIEHIQSLNSEQNTPELLNELEKFQQSLVRYFESKSMNLIFFERNFKTVHWQLQAVPVSTDIIDLAGKIKSASKQYYGPSSYIDIPRDRSISDMIRPGAPYFFWQIESDSKRFVCEIDVRSSKFPIQLGRLVLADTRILNCPDRVDWKGCSKDREEYVRLVESIRHRYERFDITSQ